MWSVTGTTSVVPTMNTGGNHIGSHPYCLFQVGGNGGISRTHPSKPVTRKVSDRVTDSDVSRRELFVISSYIGRHRQRRPRMGICGG